MREINIQSSEVRGYRPPIIQRKQYQRKLYLQRRKPVAHENERILRPISLANKL